MTDVQRWSQIHDESEARGGHLAWSAEENADLTAREEGFEPYTDRWYTVFFLSYQSLLDNP